MVVYIIPKNKLKSALRLICAITRTCTNNSSLGDFFFGNNKDEDSTKATYHFRITPSRHMTPKRRLFDAIQTSRAHWALHQSCLPYNSTSPI